MKNIKFSSLLFVLAIFGLSTSAIAQGDDLYYNPDTDAETTTTYDNADYGVDAADADYGSDDYSSEDYASQDYDGFSDYDDSYDYYYSSRIRRFNRPSTGFGFYDPCFVNSANFTPFGTYTPFGRTNIYLSFGNRGFNRFNRVNRFNRNRFFNPFFGSNPYACLLYTSPSPRDRG